MYQFEQKSFKVDFGKNGQAIALMKGKKSLPSAHGFRYHSGEKPPKFGDNFRFRVKPTSKMNSAGSNPIHCVIRINGDSKFIS